MAAMVVVLALGLTVAIALLGSLALLGTLALDVQVVRLLGHTIFTETKSVHIHHSPLLGEVEVTPKTRHAQV